MSTEKIKLCPECGSEYYAYILTCADCSVPLVMPEEIEKEKNKKPDIAMPLNEEWVTIREEGIEGVRELSDLLTRNDIFCKIVLAPGCSTGKCGCRYLLLALKENAQIAHDCIEEFHTQKYPEIKASQEWESQGRCPACGFSVNPDMKECPDCGLLLIIEK
ncbi:MAG: hypothetical protein E3K32_05820 [wastewater metagenome]|nr:hypothetical protein [Candidatus Loosdrechtia aerotolerans]